jgi:biotin carboxyl carrier protein
MIYDVTIDGKNYRLELIHTDGTWDCRLDGRPIEIDAVLTRPDVLSVISGGKAYEIRRERNGSDTHLWVGIARHAVSIRDPRSLHGRSEGAGDEKGPRKLLAPMPGRIVRLLVEVNSEVEVGQGIVVVEAMKMQNEIKSPKKGVVKKLAATPGANVNAGDVLAIVE